jgi:hypothetical protein
MGQKYEIKLDFTGASSCFIALETCGPKSLLRNDTIGAGRKNCLVIVNSLPVSRSLGTVYPPDEFDCNQVRQQNH